MRLNLLISLILILTGIASADAVFDSTYMKERAAARADRTPFGQWWVKNTNPNRPWYTDGEGKDSQIILSTFESILWGDGGASTAWRWDVSGTDPQIVFSDGVVNVNVGALQLSNITQGSALFAGASGVVSQDNSNLFWDDTNKRLGIGINSGFDPRAGLTVSGDIDILHTASVADDHAFEVDVDAAGFGDVKAIDIDYITGAIMAGEDEAIFLININEIAAGGGSIFAVDVLSTEGSADKVVALKAGVGVDPVHHDSGTFADPCTGTNDTPSTNVAAMIDGDPCTTTSIFVADDDYILIGHAAAFQEIEIILDTGSSGAGIKPTFGYSISGSHQFTTFSPVDGTNGFRNTGIIAWDASDLSNHVANSDTGTFDVIVTRTRANLGTTPILKYAKTAATTEFIWDMDGNVIINQLTVGDVTSLQANASIFSVTITDPTQDWMIGALDTADEDLAIWGTSADTTAKINVFTATGDGTDDNLLRVHGEGTYDDLSNASWLEVGFDASSPDGYVFRGKHSGTGTAEDAFIDIEGALGITADGGININDDWDAAGTTCSDLGAVTTADINAGTFDGTIGGTTPAVGSFTSLDVGDGNIANVGDIAIDSLTADDGTGPIIVNDEVEFQDDEKLLIGTGSDGEIYSHSDHLYIENSTQDVDIIFRVNDGGTPDTETMRIDGSVNKVGVRTQTPGCALEVYGTIGAEAAPFVAPVGSTGIFMKYNSTVGTHGALWCYDYTGMVYKGLQLDAIDIEFQVDGVETGKFENGGGFSLSSPSQQYLFDGRGANLILQSQTTNTASGFELFAKDGDDDDNVSFTVWGQGTPADVTAGEFAQFRWDAGNDRYQIRTTNSGGTSKPLRLEAGTTLQLEALGAGKVRSATTRANTTASAANVHIDVNGELYLSTSSARYKTIDSDMTAEKAEEVIMNLRPRKFYSKCDDDDPNKVFYGLMAEEVAEVYPEAAEYGPNGRIESYDVNMVLAALIKNQQTQAAQIAELTRRSNTK